MSVARVDPEDDNIRRFIVHHYRYDPARRERMGTAARERAGRYTWDRSVERLVALYDCVEFPETAALESCGCL